jgi:hypothetical protein
VSRNPGLIRVSIAAYRDPQLLPTVEDALAKAARPENLRFGICWQHGEELTQLPCANDKRFRIRDVHWKESQGCCWARTEAQTLYDGEEATARTCHVLFGSQEAPASWRVQAFSTSRRWETFEGAIPRAWVSIRRTSPYEPLDWPHQVRLRERQRAEREATDLIDDLIRESTARWTLEAIEAAQQGMRERCRAAKEGKSNQREVGQRLMITLVRRRRRRILAGDDGHP